MATAPDLSAQIKDAFHAALPTVEAVDIKLQELDKEIALNEKSIERVRTNIAELRRERATWVLVRGALVPREKKPPVSKAQREHAVEIVRQCFETGAVMSGGEVARRTGFAQPTCSLHIKSLIKRGALEMIKPGAYRLASKTPATPAPTSPPPRAAPPSLSVTGASLAHLEPLNGAAPESRCPKCPKPRWVKAIGMRDGSYVFRCSECSTTFVDDRRYGGRP